MSSTRPVIGLVADDKTARPWASALSLQPVHLHLQGPSDPAVAATAGMASTHTTLPALVQRPLDGLVIAGRGGDQCTVARYMLTVQDKLPFGCPRHILITPDGCTLAQLTELDDLATAAEVELHFSYPELIATERPLAAVRGSELGLGPVLRVHAGLPASAVDGDPFERCGRAGIAVLLAVREFAMPTAVQARPGERKIEITMPDATYVVGLPTSNAPADLGFHSLGSGDTGTGTVSWRGSHAELTLIVAMRYGSVEVRVPFDQPPATERRGSVEILRRAHTTSPRESLPSVAAAHREEVGRWLALLGSGDQAEAGPRLPVGSRAALLIQSVHDAARDSLQLDGLPVMPEPVPDRRFKSS